MKGARLLDLNDAEANNAAPTADVCIVGGGAVGIYLGVRLAARGRRVIVLEAGGKKGIDSQSAGFAPSFDLQRYAGALEGRAFGLGGSTSRWGGVLVPHTTADLRSDDDRSAGVWRSVVGHVSARSKVVLATLGYDRDPSFAGYPAELLGAPVAGLEQAGLAVSSTLYIPFRAKNFSALLGRANGDRLSVMVNATACGWQVASSDGERVTGVHVVSPAGLRATITADHFVIAAGALETARILLEVQDQTGAIAEGAAIGRYLGDHLSVSIADVDPEDRKRAINLFAPRFTRGWMRSFRFIEATPPTGAPRAFAHFLFENESSGFALAKEVLTALQGRRMPRLDPREAARGIAGISAMAAARFVKKTLHIPSSTPAHMQLDMEQRPWGDNRIALSEQRDAMGRRKASISWRIRDEDVADLAAVAGRVLGCWPGPAGGLPRLHPRTITPDEAKPHDAYHPVGTCRMGSDPEAVVDLDLRVRGLVNLFAVTTGVLPSAGTANPTFSALCLAEALGDRLAQND
jgi:choline dehydrogenase-like flavoprotein